MNRTGVMHLIDTLDAGGAERLAVNLVNLLPRDRFRTLLCTTRRGGPLDALVSSNVARACLDRRRTFDVAAIYRLGLLLRQHRIEIIHAHGYTVFVAALASLMTGSTSSLVWHIHHGHLADTCRHDTLQYACRAVSRRVGAAIAVSQTLADWCHTRIKMPRKQVWYIPNFVCHRQLTNTVQTLPGQSGSRIACVANLRLEKDHHTLVLAMAQVVRHVPEAHLLLVGAPDSNGKVLRSIQQTIHNCELERHITFLGCREDVTDILGRCDIGVLSSVSEGLPLSLLEYGTNELPVVATRVGQCEAVLDNGRAGLLVPPQAPGELALALLRLLGSPAQRASLGARLGRRVAELYCPARAIERVSQVYDTVMTNDTLCPTLTNC